MTNIKKILATLTVLLLVSCQQQDYIVHSDASQPEPQIVVGHSLEDMGLTISGVEEAQFPNPRPDRSDYPIRCHLLMGNERLRYSETLEGSYNVIFAGMPWDGTGAELVDLMWIQALSVEELSLSAVLVSISGKTYTPQELEDFLLWQDDSVAVYDITTLERKTDIDDVVDAFRARLYKAHENAVAGLPELEAIGRKSAFLDIDVENYNVEVLKDIDDFLQKNIGRMIAKAEFYGEGLNLPVAHVSAKYAADAQRMLDDFYSAAEMIPREYLTSPFDPEAYLGDYLNGTKFNLFDQWCYKAWCIDFYFYTWEEAANELRNGKTLYEVLELAEESTREHYRSTQCQVGVLCGLNDVVLGEAVYDDGKMKKNTDTIYGVMFRYRWEDTGPVTSLVLTDDLMSALENEGFDLSQTRATSVSISGHSGGLYFDDGIIQRYYTQIILSGQENYPLSNHMFYPTEALIESL